MNSKQTTILRKLANQADKAARLVERNRFLIDTYLSLDEARRGKVKRIKSAKELFRRLAI